MPAFQLNPFTPSKWLSGGHAQTILGRIARRKDGLIFHRRRIDTPDGDFIDLDFPEVAGHPVSEKAPLVLLLHGLEGDARRSYACETYRRLARLGIGSVGMNYRSCSGEMNRVARFYHSGATEDVALALATLAEWFPHNRRGLIGFSLGANLTLKFLGERGRTGQRWVDTAVAVSPPFDMKKSATLLERGLARLYTRYFLRSLRKKVLAKKALLEPILDLEKLLAAQTLQEFDNFGTAPLASFRDANEYYDKCSTAQFLPQIKVPTLLLRALDDPIFAPDDVPYEAIAANPFLTAGITPKGGHVGFVQGRPGAFSCWAEQEATRFLGTHLLGTHLLLT
jgi:uncharacterized protein